MKTKSKDKKPVQAILVPPYILWTGKILTTLSPFLASRFAAKLFLTPFKYKLPKREMEMEQNSHQEKIIIPSINRDIVTYTYGNGTRKALLVHGWSGTGTQLSQIAEALIKINFTVYSFDAPAHGKASGKMSMMPYFIEAVKHLNSINGPFEVLIGHSLGGMASLRAISDGLQTQKLVIIGTANSVTHITKDFAKNMKLNDKVASKMKTYFDEKFGEDMDNYSGAVSAENVKIPTLIIHDVDDVDVHISSAYEISEKIKESELLITNDLGHRRILGNKDVINKITTFLGV